MSIKIRSFGGPIIWLLRKKYSNLTTKFAYLIVDSLREKKIVLHISKFTEDNNNIPIFKFLMLETINRCNGKCAFCPANVHSEKRPFMKMPDEMIDHILDELVEMDWNGTIFPQVNNEPFIDKRIFDILKKIRIKRPDSKIFIITNGTLLTPEYMDRLVGLADIVTINDYSKHYNLSDNIKTIYNHVKKHKSMFENMDITIARRYTEEVLSTRAGNAPNKKEKEFNIESPCIYPFTDMIIFPDGNVGICCNDCSEVTKMGNVYEESLQDIWKGKRFCEVRNALRKGRLNYQFCKQCDVIDAGSRENVI